MLNYPLLEVRVSTPTLELRGATDELLDQLADVVRSGKTHADPAPYDDPMSFYETDPDLADVYADVVASNEDHLSLAAADRGKSAAEHARDFESYGNRNIMFAVMAAGRLVGRVDLNPVDPPKYTIGYWVDREHTGQRIATTAVDLAVRHARSVLGATDVYAGVVPVNAASIRVLEHNGFVRVAELDGYDRYHLPLDGGAPRSPEPSEPPTRRQR